MMVIYEHICHEQHIVFPQSKMKKQKIRPQVAYATCGHLYFTVVKQIHSSIAVKTADINRHSIALGLTNVILIDREYDFMLLHKNVFDPIVFVLVQRPQPILYTTQPLFMQILGVWMLPWSSRDVCAVMFYLLIEILFNEDHAQITTMVNIHLVFIFELA
jgi:hypothetical protein